MIKLIFTAILAFVFSLIMGYLATISNMENQSCDIRAWNDIELICFFTMTIVFIIYLGAMSAVCNGYEHWLVKQLFKEEKGEDNEQSNS